METKRWLAPSERFFKVTLHNKLSLTCGSVHGFNCSSIGQKVWPELFSLSLLHVSPVIIKWVRGSFLLTNSRLQCFGFRIHWFRILTQHFRLNTDLDPGFWWPKCGGGGRVAGVSANEYSCAHGAQIYFILRYLKILKNYPESSAVIENAAILQIKKKTIYEHTADRVHNPTKPI